MAAGARMGFCLLMSKSFRPWTIDQPLLLPAIVQDFVGADHLARFVLALVVEQLDLREIEGTYGSARGYPPYHPAMMTALLLYAYSRGLLVAADREGGAERVDFMARRAGRAGFPHRLRLPQASPEGARGAVRAGSGALPQAGLSKLGHVALDGTKIKANASKHKAMSYARMVEGEKSSRPRSASG